MTVTLTSVVLILSAKAFWDCRTYHLSAHSIRVGKTCQRVDFSVERETRSYRDPWIWINWQELWPSLGHLIRGSFRFITRRFFYSLRSKSRSHTGR